jgi:hypothetical protein
MILRWFFKSWLRHKWYVLVAGLRLGVPLWQLLVHDLSKLHPAELRHYAESFGYAGADRWAFNHHVHRNPHHWEHWMMWDGTILQMPSRYVGEMVADWLGAHRARQGHWDIDDWFTEHGPSMRLHGLTKHRLRVALEHVRRLKW